MEFGTGAKGKTIGIFEEKYSDRVWWFVIIEESNGMKNSLGM